MLEKYNRYKILKSFLDAPLMEFGLREISRKVKLAPTSVLNYLKEFERENIIIKKEGKQGPVYISNRDNNSFIFFKKIGILNEIHNSGLIEFLWEKLAPSAIILYGSQIKGEAIDDSDIDIFLIGKEKKIDLKEFENKLSRKVHIMFEENEDKIPKELKNNLVNGIVLKGYLKLF